MILRLPGKPTIKVAGNCYNEKLVESRTQIQQLAAGAVSDVPVKLSEGESITVICKNIRHVFVNQIRKMAGV